MLGYGSVGKGCTHPTVNISENIAITMRLWDRTAQKRLPNRYTQITALVGRIIQARALKNSIFRILDLEGIIFFIKELHGINVPVENQLWA
jgi:hypothetical protein